MHHAIMRICICHRLSIICTQKWFWGILRVKMSKYCVLTPKTHYPAWIRFCWCIACQNRFNGLSSRSVERFCVQTMTERNKERNKENNWEATLAIWGEVTPAAILTKCGEADMVDIITCAIGIWWLPVKGCGCGERGNFALSHWLEVSPLQHYSTMWPCTCDGTNKVDYLHLRLNMKVKRKFETTEILRTGISAIAKQLCVML